MGLRKDREFMAMALNLAQKAKGKVSPNPLVGAVIVKGGVILSKGYHTKFGSSHAEVLALKKCGQSAKGATLYVTLEPCSHHGKTPPCVDAIIETGIKKVVIGSLDPNPLVNGKGIEALKAAGIKVVTGILADECIILNEAYRKWIKAKIPFVHLKSAVTIDGSVAKKLGTRDRLTCSESMERVHLLRNEYDAIAVGVNTVLIDDPKLTYRGKKKGRNPLRIIFDTQFRVPVDAQIFREEGRTLVFTSKEYNRKLQDIKCRYEGVDIVCLGLKDGRLDLDEALSYLGREGVASLLLEGGATLANAFLAQGLIDKLSVIYTSSVAEKDAPKLFSEDTPSLHFSNSNWEIVDEDAWFSAYLN